MHDKETGLGSSRWPGPKSANQPFIHTRGLPHHLLTAKGAVPLTPSLHAPPTTTNGCQTAVHTM
jgi:hypothetical protein